MGLIELPLTIAGWILTASIAGIGGAFTLQGKTDKRIEKIREFSEARIERIIETNNQKIETIIAANTLQNENVLTHIKNVEKALNDLRAEMPEKYTLKSDHLRLVDKVEELSLQFYRHREADVDHTRS